MPGWCRELGSQVDVGGGLCTSEVGCVPISDSVLCRSRACYDVAGAQARSISPRPFARAR
jgi:hypothetical protein